MYDSYNPWQQNCTTSLSLLHFETIWFMAGHRSAASQKNTWFYFFLSYQTLEVCLFVIPLFFLFSLFQESEWAAGVTLGVTSPFTRHGERSESRSAQGRVEGEGAETSGGHQDPAWKAASTGERERLCDDKVMCFRGESTPTVINRGHFETFTLVLFYKLAQNVHTFSPINAVQFIHSYIKENLPIWERGTYILLNIQLRKLFLTWQAFNSHTAPSSKKSIALWWLFGVVQKEFDIFKKLLMLSWANRLLAIALF